MTTVVERAVVDTNVLLAATDRGRTGHGAALDVLNAWPAAGTTLYTSGQILREYYAVATRPPAVNGLGLRASDALTNIRTLRSRLNVLAENEKVADRLIALLEDVPCTGKQVHDANVVATMLSHGIRGRYTWNGL